MPQDTKSSNFDDYLNIINQYIFLWENKDSVFKYKATEEGISENLKLNNFFILMDVNRNFDEVITITNIMLSARFGEVFSYKYKDFKNIAHLMLDYSPSNWKHFLLVCKTYGHHELIERIKADYKIKIKIKSNEKIINEPNHLFNEYIEFLCPSLNGRLIGWGLGEDLTGLNFKINKNSYPHIIFKNLLNENPRIDGGDSVEILKYLKKYIQFNLDCSETIQNSILNVVLGFIVNYFKNSDQFQIKYYGEYVSDIKVMALLNPIIEFLELNDLIEEISFFDNVCYVNIASSEHLNMTDIYYAKIQILKDSIKYALSEINGQDECLGLFAEYN